MTRIVKKADIRREEIISAARVLFQTRDYEKATMQELIETLNIAKGTLYYYFSSKQELLEAVIENIIDEEFEKKEKLLKFFSNGGTGAIEKLKILIEGSDVADENEKILETLHHPENIEMHTKQLGRYIARLAPLWASVLTEGCDEGVFKAEYPLEYAEFILAGIQFLTDPGFYPWSSDQLERRRMAFPFLVETIMGAIEGTFDFLREN